jgi:hypothetical protein
MDQANRNTAPKWPNLAVESLHYSPVALRRTIEGRCSNCGNHTSSIVIWAGKPVYLCPPCGTAIRTEESAIICSWHQKYFGFELVVRQGTVPASHTICNQCRAKMAAA